MAKHQRQKFLREIAKKILNKSSNIEETNFLDSYYNSFDKMPNVSDLISHEELLSIKKEIKLGVDEDIIRSKREKFRKLYIWISSAAAVVIISFLGFYSLFYKYQLSSIDRNLVSNDINPGKNKAVLTLANGQKILLDAAEGEIVSGEPSLKITTTVNGRLIYDYIANTNRELKSSDDLYNTITTPKGGQYQIALPDGSLVWLNASSSLRFPTQFRNKDRIVSLHGEAYFEVAKLSNSEFIVKTDNQEVKVLGTHFNINSYTDEHVVKTTLIEGSVKVSQLSGNKISKLLKASEQAINDNENIAVKTADIESVISWKNGDFVFRNEDFKTTMRKISRWYDVDVVYEADAPEDLELGGWVSRNKKLSAVLKLMELTEKVHFKIDGRRLTVTK